ncbi:divergent PAP2 family protein [Candidatus Saccharibacteria bacterium]|nr:divergent PAP2 family protein [Candidatus Saccharibacteria bacterium]NCS83102.1 divergent PAP2 family protein [Candidatus Saccharibacteria bacterium]
MEAISPYIIAGALGWLSAQLVKYMLLSIRKKQFVPARQLYFSGNMPSAHSATTIAVLVVIGVYDGVQSGLFGLALVFASVVLYDAMMVRRSSGEQGRALTEMIAEQKSKVPLPRVAKGHTPTEVAVGACLGVVVGLVVIVLGLGS